MRRESFELYLDRGTAGGFLRATGEPVQKDAQQTEQNDAQADGRFEYQGYHFEPVGALPADWQKSAGKSLVSDPTLGISGYFGSKHPYSHDSFYAASGSTADVFRCAENGKYYIPGENELFEYAGEFEPFQREAEQPTSKTPEVVAQVEQPAPEKKRSGNSRVERNYRAFARLFPEIVSGEYRYLELRDGEGGGYMPLIIERIGDDEISLSHTYLQNGDVMRDPEMTFRIGKDKGTMEPLTYQQDALGLYQQVYPEPGKWVPKLRNDLNSFTEHWLKNIEAQGRTKYRAITERNGEDVEFSFDKDGNPIAEVDPFPSEQRREALAETSPWWVEYLDTKAAYSDDILMYQVGDFFEMFGEDAKQAAALLDLQLGTRPVAGVGRVAFCGVPTHNLEKYMNALREKYDVAISALNADGSGREVYEVPSIDNEAARDIDAHEAEFGADGYRAFPGNAPDRAAAMDYDAVKSAHPEELVLYQVGDNYELRGVDARTAARLLKLIAKDGQGVDYDTASTVSFSIHADTEIEVLRRTHGIVVCTMNEDGEQEIRVLPPLAAPLQEVTRPYKVGDTVYLDNREYRIFDIRGSSVELMRPGQDTAFPRTETIGRFELLVWQDQRNKHITEYQQ